MIGHACAAGSRSGHIHPDAAAIAGNFSVRPDRLRRALETLETQDRPQIVILQNTEHGAKVAAVGFFSSVWSKSYAKVGTSYGKVRRDFHYQCLLAAISALVEIGCERIRVESSMSCHPWRRDAYICLLEVVRNIQKNMSRCATVHLELGSYEARMVESLDRERYDYDMQDHRPVGTGMRIFEGLNIRTVFVENARVALQNASPQSTYSAMGHCPPETGLTRLELLTSCNLVRNDRIFFPTSHVKKRAPLHNYDS